jgi:hypothetical protein
LIATLHAPGHRRLHGLVSDKDMGGNNLVTPGRVWNDTISHHNVFAVYALDFAQYRVTGIFKRPDMLTAIGDPVLAQAIWTGCSDVSPHLRI